ncbi:hypothetical protein [Sorangium sp. So ce1153]|uniref:hypothetical protein n=1 Tax=Sorangium sp. So ce1153 TaxID=3133333 RepID=UPI003F633A3C
MMMLCTSEPLIRMLPVMVTPGPMPTIVLLEPGASVPLCFPGSTRMNPGVEPFAASWSSLIEFTVMGGLGGDINVCQAPMVTTCARAGSHVRKWRPMDR